MQPTPAPAATEPVPRWARWFVGVFLALFLVCGVFGLEVWPLTGWRLFADARQARQPGFQAVTVDTQGRDAHPLPRPARRLPGRRPGPQGLRQPPLGRQAAVCQAWAQAVRDRGREVAEIRIYQTVTDVSRRDRDRGAPRPGPSASPAAPEAPMPADEGGRVMAARRRAEGWLFAPVTRGGWPRSDRAVRAAGGPPGQRSLPGAGHPAAALFRPISFLRLLERMPSPETVAVLQAFALGAAVLATVGLLTRVTLPLAWLAALPLVAMTSSLGKVVHNDVLLLLCLVPLLPSRAGAAWSLDARQRPAAAPGLAYGWPVRTAMVVVAGAYFFSGLAKLLHAGPGWVLSGNLRWVLYASSDTQPEPNPLPCSWPTGRCSPT